MRPIRTAQRLRLVTTLAISAGGGLVGAGCAPWGEEEVEDGSAEPMPEGEGEAGGGVPTDVTTPLIEADRSFTGDTLYEWISGAGDLTFYRYEPAGFLIQAHGRSGDARTLFARIDGEIVLTRRLVDEDWSEAVRVDVDTASIDGGLHRFEAEVVYDTGRTTSASVEFDVVFNVTAVATDPLFGGVLAGTAEAGSYWFSGGADTVPRHLPADKLDQGLEGNERFKTYPSVTTARAASGMSVLRAKYDPDLGGFWLGSLFQGLTLFLPGDDARSDRFLQVHVPNDDLAPLPTGDDELLTDAWWAALNDLSSRDTVVDVLPDPQGLWIATFNGLIRWNHGGTPFDDADDSWRVVEVPDPQIAALARAGAGRIWVGTWDFAPEGSPALFTFDPEAEDVAWQAIEVPADRVLSLAISRDGAVWAGTDDGLYRLHEGEIRRFGAAEGLRDEDVLAILPERHGDGVWFGTVDICGGDGGGLHRLRPGDGPEDVVVLTREDGLRDDDVTSLAFGSDGALWAGTFNLMAAANIPALFGVDVPECGGVDATIDPRTGNDGLSKITQPAPGEFDIDNF